MLRKGRKRGGAEIQYGRRITERVYSMVVHSRKTDDDEV